MGSLLRKELFPGEDSYFKKNPAVTGMAAEDDRVILNPYSNLNENERSAVYLNEASRIHMRKNGVPEFELTDSQNAFLNGNTYKDASGDERRATIIARIISGDSSAGDVTDAQRQIADQVRSRMDKVEFSNAFKYEAEKGDQ